MLHIVSSRNAIERVVKHLSAHDMVLFIADGTYDIRYIQEVSNYVIDEDLKVRGIELPNGIEAIDYRKFVDLVIENGKSITW